MTLPASRARFLDDLDRFSGTVVRGDDEIAPQVLASNRVGVVGTAKAVAPLLARLARHSSSLDVFLVEPAWVLPRLGPLGRHGLQTVSAATPTRIRRSATEILAEQNLRSAFRDDWTRRQLTPRHRPRADNTLYSNRFFRVLRRRNVRLVTWPVAGADEHGLRTADGVVRRLDVIVIP